VHAGVGVTNVVGAVTVTPTRPKKTVRFFGFWLRVSNFCVQNQPLDYG
jgi:hypothetical protein